MKKFVSIVLVLALALSLCTVAFAAKTYDNLYEWENNKWNKVDLTGAAISYTEPSETKQDGELLSGTVGYYTVKLADESAVNLFVVSEDDATYRMDVNGKTVFLTTEANANNGVTYTMVATLVKSSDKCGEFKFAAGTYTNDKVAKVVDSDGDVSYYALGPGAARLLVDGVVRAGTLIANPTLNEHDWDIVATKDTAADTITGTAVCSECGQKATVTSNKAKIPSNATVENETYGGDTVYLYFVEGTTAAGTTSTTVDSSKTFDAGVAMYVGLSLMSVAGSAVVIGKKKEF